MSTNLKITSPISDTTNVFSQKTFSLTTLPVSFKPKSLQQIYSEEFIFTLNYFGKYIYWDSIMDEFKLDSKDILNIMVKNESSEKNSSASLSPDTATSNKSISFQSDSTLASNTSNGNNNPQEITNEIKIYSDSDTNETVRNPRQRSLSFKMPKITDFWLCLEKLPIEEEDERESSFIIIPWNKRESIRNYLLTLKESPISKENTPKLKRSPEVIFSEEFPNFYSIPFTYLIITSFEYIPNQVSLSESNFIENNLRLDFLPTGLNASYLKDSTKSVNSDTILLLKKKSLFHIRLSLTDSLIQKRRKVIENAINGGNVLESLKSSGVDQPVLGTMELVCKSLHYRYITDLRDENPNIVWLTGREDSIRIVQQNNEMFIFSIDDENEMIGKQQGEEELRRLIFRAYFELQGIIRLIFYIDFVCFNSKHYYALTRKSIPITSASFKYSEKQKSWKIKSIRRPTPKNLSILPEESTNDTKLRCTGFNIMFGPHNKEHSRKIIISNLIYIVKPSSLSIKLDDMKLFWFMDSESSIIVIIPPLQVGIYTISFFSNGTPIEISGLQYEIVSEQNDIYPTSNYEHYTSDTKRNCLNQGIIMQRVIDNDFENLCTSLVQKESDSFEVDLLQRTAFHLAMILNNIKCAALLLLSSGEEMLVHKDIFGMTAFDSARFFGHSKSVSMMEAFWKEHSSIAEDLNYQLYIRSIEKFFSEIIFNSSIEEASSPVSTKDSSSFQYQPSSSTLYSQVTSQKLKLPKVNSNVDIDSEEKE